MAKELPYFRFTVSEWQNGDISLESYELRGLFVEVCCYYWIQDCSVAVAKLQKRFSGDMGLLKKLFDLEIIEKENDNGFVSISFLDEQYDLLSKRRLRLQKAGSKGGKQKASNAIAGLQQRSSYKDKDKDKIKSKIVNTNFIKPTEKQIIDYCTEKNFKVNANMFLAHYDSNGWKVGKNPMISWEASLKTWHYRDNPEPLESKEYYNYVCPDGCKKDKGHRTDLLNPFTKCTVCGKKRIKEK